MGATQKQRGGDWGMVERQPDTPTVAPGRHAEAPAPGATGQYLLTRQVFLRLLGVVYLTAFASLWPQLPGLIGAQGLLPAATFLTRVHSLVGGDFWTWPTLAWLDSSDAFLQGLCGAGIL